MSMYALLRNNPQPSALDMENAFQGPFCNLIVVFCDSKSAVFSHVGPTCLLCIIVLYRGFFYTLKTNLKPP